MEGGGGAGGARGDIAGGDIHLFASASPASCLDFWLLDRGGMHPPTTSVFMRQRFSLRTCTAAYIAIVGNGALIVDGYNIYAQKTCVKKPGFCGEKSGATRKRKEYFKSKKKKCKHSFFKSDTSGKTLLGPQPRFGGKPLEIRVVCPRKGTPVLKEGEKNRRPEATNT